MHNQVEAVRTGMAVWSRSKDCAADIDDAQKQVPQRTMASAIHTSTVASKPVVGNTDHSWLLLALLAHARTVVGTSAPHCMILCVHLGWSSTFLALKSHTFCCLTKVSLLIHNLTKKQWRAA